MSGHCTAESMTWLLWKYSAPIRWLVSVSNSMLRSLAFPHSVHPDGRTIWSEIRLHCPMFRTQCRTFRIRWIFGTESTTSSSMDTNRSFWMRCRIHCRWIFITTSRDTVESKFEFSFSSDGCTIQLSPMLRSPTTKQGKMFRWSLSIRISVWPGRCPMSVHCNKASLIYLILNWATYRVLTPLKLVECM